MPTIEHILFPIDFSERCCSAVPFVESMANRFHARITLLGVGQPLYFLGDGLVQVSADELLQDIKARLDHSLAKDFANIPVDRVAELGDPAQVIGEFVRTRGVNLIMMPTHGYGPFRTLLLGSVTAKVLHDVECPVWTAAHVADPPCRDHVACRNVLCAVDGAPHSVALMKWAGEFAKEAGAMLRLVHVIPGMEGFPSHQMDREFEEERQREASQMIARLQESAGIDAPACVTAGNVPARVGEEARRHGVDLIVIGRGAIHETLGRLRTCAYGIIRQSPCPVLSV